MGLLGADSSDDRVEALVENAQGDSVTETKLTRVGSKILGTGTFEDRPLVEYLRADEQPHYALFNTFHEFEFDDEDLDVAPGYWQILVATDQRLLVLMGDESGDSGEVIPYGVVDPESVTGEKDGFVEHELGFVAGGVECEFEIDGEVPISEVRATADYVRERAETDDVSEAERPRGLVYDVPNLDVEATVWRPDGDDEDEDADGAEVDDKGDGDEENAEATDDDSTDAAWMELPDDAVAGARSDGVEVVLFDRRLRFERGDRTAEIPLAYVLDVEVDDDEAEFEFGFAGEGGATFEVEHAELEVAVEDPGPFERVADELEARQSGEADADPGDDEAVQTLRERYAAGDVSTEEYHERLAVLRDEDPDDADGPPVVPGGSDAVTTDDVMTDGIPGELQDRFDALAALPEDA